MKILVANIKEYTKEVNRLLQIVKCRPYVLGLFFMCLPQAFFQYDVHEKPLLVSTLFLIGFLVGEAISYVIMCCGKKYKSLSKNEKRVLGIFYLNFPFFIFLILVFMVFVFL